MIILVGGTKGGVGKSTLATNLVIMRAKAGKDVLLIDADEQETSSDFTALRNSVLKNGAGYTCTKLTGPSLHSDGKRLAKKYDDLIIDAGGRDTSGQRAALVIADILIIPFIPRSFDVWTLETVGNMVAEARAFNPKLRASAFINRADSSGIENKEAARYIQKEKELEFLPYSLGYRKSFGKASAQGLGVIELSPPDEKAHHEITQLYQAIFNSFSSAVVGE